MNEALLLGDQQCDKWNGQELIPRKFHPNTRKNFFLVGLPSPALAAQRGCRVSLTRGISKPQLRTQARAARCGVPA